MSPTTYPERPSSLSSSDWQRLAELTAQLTARQVIDEALRPLRHDINQARQELADFREDMAPVHHAVMGNGSPSLSAQITRLGDECRTEHQRLHDRINARRQQQRDNPDHDLLQQIRGGWRFAVVVGACLSGFGGLAMEFYRTFFQHR